jgi:hypothetical protein
MNVSPVCLILARKSPRFLAASVVDIALAMRKSVIYRKWISKEKTIPTKSSLLFRMRTSSRNEIPHLCGHGFALGDGLETPISFTLMVHHIRVAPF